MEDKAIISRLFERQEDALQEISLSYGRLYTSVFRGILSDESDIEECKDDLLLSVWNSIPPNAPQRLSPYLCALAKRIAIDRLRHNTRKKRNPGFTVLLSELEDCIPDEEPSSEDDPGDVIRDALNRFLRGLDKENRVLFLRRYVYSESVSDLSARFGIKENSINKKLSRTRQKLKEFLTKEGIRL